MLAPVSERGRWPRSEAVAKRRRGERNPTPPPGARSACRLRPHCPIESTQSTRPTRCAGAQGLASSPNGISVSPQPAEAALLARLPCGPPISPNALARGREFKPLFAMLAPRAPRRLSQALSPLHDGHRLGRASPSATRGPAEIRPMILDWFRESPEHRDAITSDARALIDAVLCIRHWCV